MRRAAKQLRSRLADGAAGALLAAARTSPALERGAVGALRHTRPVPGTEAVRSRFRKDLLDHLIGQEQRLRPVALPGGLTLWIDPVGLLGDLYFYGVPREPETVRFVRQQLRPGDVFVDVGANEGYFALIAAGCVASTGHVYAFEPNPTLMRQLERQVASNRLDDVLDLVQLAVSDRDAEALEFFVSQDPSNTGISSLTPWDGHLESGALTSEATIQVPVTTLDSWTRRVGLERMDMVKIDVEGAEQHVVAGMAQCIERLRPRHIICEAGARGAAAASLREAGYRMTVLEWLRADVQWGNLAFSREDV